MPTICARPLVTTISFYAPRLKAKREDGARYSGHVASIERDYSWVVAERGGFGSGDYDFARMDIGRMRAESVRVEARVAELKGKVNSKVRAVRLPCGPFIFRGGPSCSVGTVCIPGRQPRVNRAPCMGLEWVVSDRRWQGPLHNVTPASNDLHLPFLFLLHAFSPI